MCISIQALAEKFGEIRKITLNDCVVSSDDVKKFNRVLRLIDEYKHEIKSFCIIRIDGVVSVKVRA